MLLRMGAMLALVGCASEQAGIEVTFELAPQAISVTTAEDGRPLQIEHASLALGSVELVPCDAASAAGNPEARARGGLGLLHTEGSATRLGTPAIIALDAEAAPIELGILRPPPGRYCALRQHFFAADSDALGLTDEADVGATLRVRGSVAGAPFELRTDSALQVDTPLEPALELTLEGIRQASFELGLREDGNGAQLFAGASLLAGRERDDAQAILANLRDAIGARRKP